MNLQKIGLIIATTAQLFISDFAVAEDRISSGYLSSVTSKTVVLDGVVYRFYTNREEKTPIEVQCAVKDKQIDCEELRVINSQNRVRAKVSFNSAGLVIRVQVLDVLK